MFEEGGRGGDKEMNSKMKWGIAGILVASIAFSSIYVYDTTYKPIDIYLEGTVVGIYIGTNFAFVGINTTDGEIRTYPCYLTWGIVLLQYSNESQIYHFHITKSKSDEYFFLSYEEVEKDERH